MTQEPQTYEVLDNLIFYVIQPKGRKSTDKRTMEVVNTPIGSKIFEGTLEECEAYCDIFCSGLEIVRKYKDD